MSESLGKRIAAARVAKGLSQPQLAGLVLDSGRVGTLSNWETGKTVPDADALAGLSRALKVSADYLLGLTPESKEPGEPSAQQVEWIGRMFDRITSDERYTAAEKRALLAEVNAAGMRIWAVSAEWASGQRGIAMQDAEQGASARATTLKHVPGGSTSEEPEESLYISDEEAHAADVAHRQPRGQGRRAKGG